MSFASGPLPSLGLRLRNEPMGPWACDSCPSRGTGWVEAQAHANRTGHRSLTATDWEGLQ